jgi:metal-responsive CopG/Arc/MetJ family transcriptional regulator
MFSKNSIDLGKPLADRANAAAEKAGYSSLEEFVRHAVERELAHLEEAEAKDEVTKQLRGLGYIE